MNPNAVRLRPDLRARMEARIEATRPPATGAPVEHPPQQAPSVAAEPSGESCHSALEDLVHESEGLYSQRQFDPKYPHFTVQSSIRNLLLAAIALSRLHETHPGGQDRQRKLQALIADYERTCQLPTKGDVHVADNS
jgi:hypothetical protein